MTDYTDVVVLGAGMAGLAAAARAAESGARVAVLEKALTAGGTVPLMGGFLWTAKDLETFLGRMTHADPSLAELAVSQFEESVAWVAGLGVTIGPRNDHFFEWGHGYPMTEGPQQYVDVLCALLASRGVDLRLQSPARSIGLDERGRVRTVTYFNRRHERIREIECRAVVIATGGFQANTEMLTRYMGRWADRMFLRATPLGTGDGIEMTRAIGARQSRGYHAFYGQLMPAPPAVVAPADFRFVTQYNSIHMVIVNRAGERFVDESIYDSLTAQALAHEPEALGFLITDGRIDEHDRRHPATPTSSMAPTERMQHIRDRGGTVLEADDIETLANQLQDLGVYRDRILATLDEFNQAAASGTTNRLPAPKKHHAHAIMKPPFYAIPVVPGISFTHGGIAINSATEVLDRESRPIPGLYAAGADAGGLFYEQYLGGAATSLVLGRVAGQNSAAVADN